MPAPRIPPLPRHSPPRPLVLPVLLSPQVGATDAAFQVWHQLRADGRTKPNVRTFTELIGACCKAGALDAAFGLLYQMLSEQVGTCSTAAASPPCRSGLAI